MLHHSDETRPEELVPNSISNSQEKSSLEHSSMYLDNLHQDSSSRETDNFVDIETNEESESGKTNFVELEADSNEASFSFCKNPFSQWFL